MSQEIPKPSPLLINTYLSWQRAESTSDHYYRNTIAPDKTHVSNLVKAADKASKKFGQACEENGLDRSDTIKSIEEYLKTKANRGPAKDQERQLGG